jgi:hypothetical protein
MSRPLTIIPSHLFGDSLQQTMAESYANVVQTNLSRNCMPPDVQDPNDDEIDNPNTAKPIFLQDQDIFGSVKVTKPMWVTHVEIYKTIGTPFTLIILVSGLCLAGFLGFCV